VFAYLNYYNRNRLHSTLKQRTPYEARVGYRQPVALAACNPVSDPRGESQSKDARRPRMTLNLSHDWSSYDTAPLNLLSKCATSADGEVSWGGSGGVRGRPTR
jgi:hypothetical protein